MPFIPHTEDEVREMLSAIGVDDIESLFDEIPRNLRCPPLERVPPQRSEAEVARLMGQRAAQDGQPVCFLGAGAYDHHIPAAVWEIVTRGEFYSAYTPYQAEASQGTLQLLYEYQSMMTALTAMDASNASLYDGASALAEAVLMAVRANRKSKSKRILLPQSVHPAYRATVQAIVSAQGIELIEIPFDSGTGAIDFTALDRHAGSDIAALVVPQPNFFGVLEDVHALTDWARAQGALTVAVTNPVSLAILTPPGEWGEQGAEIVCGEGQPMGIPLSSGGPYFGFLCCKQAHVRQMPGRIIGRTVDVTGKEGYTLTLQAREQHIRRSKATSNICTNQGLMVTAATIHMALLGPQGIEAVAGACHDNTRYLVQQLTAIDGVELLFSGAHFHEAALRLPQAAAPLLLQLAEQGFAGGYDPGSDYPELGDALLVCATEVRTRDEIDRFAATLGRLLGG